MNRRLLRNGSFLSKVLFHMVNVKRVCYPTTFFKSLINHKRFVLRKVTLHICSKRQKSCTLIVILVKCLYLTSPIFNSSSKSNRLFLLQRRKYMFCVYFFSLVFYNKAVTVSDVCLNDRHTRILDHDVIESYDGFSQLINNRFHYRSVKKSVVKGHQSARSEKFQTPFVVPNIPLLISIDKRKVERSALTFKNLPN